MLLENLNTKQGRKLRTDEHHSSINDTLTLQLEVCHLDPVKKDY